MGDVLTRIQQAEAAFDTDQKEKMTAKLMGGEKFDLEDFLDQLIAVRRMGPIANVLAMMPGMGQVKLSGSWSWTPSTSTGSPRSSGR